MKDTVNPKNASGYKQSGTNDTPTLFDETVFGQVPDTPTKRPVVPTAEQIEAARTAAGGWTADQLAAWGVPWPPPKGWRQQLIAESKRHHRKD